MQKPGGRLLGIALVAIVLGLGLWKWRDHPAPVSGGAVPAVPRASASLPRPTRAEGQRPRTGREAEPASPQRDARVHGFVLGPDGTPVAGAFVEGQPRGTRLATTGNNGEFWFSLARDSVVVRALPR